MAFSKDINELVSEDSSGLLNKHESWERVTLQDVVEVVNGYAFSSSGFNTGKGLPLIRIRDIVSGKTDTTYEGAYSEEYIVQNGDLLVGMDGDFNSSFWRSGVALLNQRVCKLIANETFYSKKFLAYLLPGYLDAINQNTSAVTVKHLSSKTIQCIPLPLPPRKEQDRLVEKLEELFSEFDSGIEELKAAQTKLSQYRQSLLKSAVEGSLTQQWRAENRDRVQETGEQLLARILKQRREQWQQQKLAEFAEKGKIPPKNWQDKYPEPVQPDTTDLPELPEGWVWASLDMLGDIVSGVTKGTKRKADIAVREVPYLRVANVQRGFLNLDEIKTIPATESDIKKYTLVPGDILFNEGGDRDKLGRGWVWYGEVENCIHQNHVFRMRAFVTDLVPEFISHHGNTFGKLWFQSAGKQTTNLASINKGILQEFPVPLAPVIEQNKIIELLEEELTLLAKQEEYTLAALTASEAQRKNILKSAFSGQLVPQDPNDEPASVLLEKIKQEREALAKKPKTKQIKTKSAMKKITVEELTKWVSDYEGNSFTFGELQKTFQGDYDQLKDCVFEILSAKEPILKQVFDQKLNAITFIKEDK
ncbi:restriction endonuclease subunit S [Vibrio cholerae]|uniref:restriction endonuclease subunit S n=1 Tax=Vibrio cholerae TaxID=666 RepID=UPI000E0A74BA|nr:restriction endonuclease subunit S [Vibrio cholerae]EGR0541916.1 restriction endonuclease subunit S [Vibrio cholerae]